MHKEGRMWKEAEEEEVWEDKQRFSSLITYMKWKW